MTYCSRKRLINLTTSVYYSRNSGLKIWLGTDLLIGVIFTFSGSLGLQGSTLIWEQSFAQPGARRREGFHICHYLS